MLLEAPICCPACLDVLPQAQRVFVFRTNFFRLSDRSVDSGDSSSSDGLVIGLSLALGFTLVVIGALAVYKFRVRKNARRLMEDMGDGDL